MPGARTPGTRIHPHLKVGSPVWKVDRDTLYRHQTLKGTWLRPCAIVGETKASWHVEHVDGPRVAYKINKITLLVRETHRWNTGYGPPQFLFSHQEVADWEYVSKYRKTIVDAASRCTDAYRLRQLAEVLHVDDGEYS